MASFSTTYPFPTSEFSAERTALPFVRIYYPPPHHEPRIEWYYFGDDGNFYSGGSPESNTVYRELWENQNSSSPRYTYTDADREEYSRWASSFAKHGPQCKKTPAPVDVAPVVIVGPASNQIVEHGSQLAIRQAPPEPTPSESPAVEPGAAPPDEPAQSIGSSPDVDAAPCDNSPLSPTSHEPETWPDHPLVETKEPAPESYEEVELDLSAEAVGSSEAESVASTVSMIHRFLPQLTDVGEEQEPAYTNASAALTRPILVVEQELSPHETAGENHGTSSSTSRTLPPIDSLAASSNGEQPLGGAHCVTLRTSSLLPAVSRCEEGLAAEKINPAPPSPPKHLSSPVATPQVIDLNHKLLNAEPSIPHPPVLTKPEKDSNSKPKQGAGKRKRAKDEDSEILAQGSSLHPIKPLAESDDQNGQQDRQRPRKRKRPNISLQAHGETEGPIASSSQPSNNGDGQIHLASPTVSVTSALPLRKSTRKRHPVNPDDIRCW